jgi:copper(I)-binding protein
VMLIRLRHPLEPGDTFDLALRFLQQGEIHVQVAVENR